jgi:hypothetical protein
MSVDIKVRERLEALAKKSQLTPENVVTEAMDPKSPLHGHFTWDNEKAGHAHRLEEARALIRKVKYVHTIETRTVSVPYYVHDPRARAQGYVRTASVKPEAERNEEVLDQELGRAIAMMERAVRVAALLGREPEFARVLSAMRALRESALPEAAE